MLSVKIKIFKWEIIIQDENLGKLHITHFPICNNIEDEENSTINNMLGYKYFDIDPLNVSKRINALVRDHGMIDYIFRGLGHALLRYQGDAITLLDGVMHSLSKMRYDLWEKGATTTELDAFDNKVHKNFSLMLSVIKDKADDASNEIKELDKQLYNVVKRYDIKNYRSGNIYHN